MPNPNGSIEYLGATPELEFERQDLTGKRALLNALMGNAMMGNLYLPNSGKAGVATSVLGSIAGVMAQKRNSEGLRGWFERNFEEENRQREAEYRRKTEEEQRKFIMEVRKADLVAQAQERAKRNNPQISYDSASGTFIDPLSRTASPNEEARDFLLRKAAAGRPVTNVNMPATVNETAFQKALGEKDAGEFVKWRDNAVAAKNTLAQADAIEQILGAQQTGKMEQAKAIAGQYFGTEAGANLQALQAAIQPAVLAQVKQLGAGSGISDADRKFIEAGMPGFGNDPRANERILKIMRAGAQRNVDMYDQAQAYVNNHGTLAGYQPAFKPLAQVPQTKNPQDMSDDEILAALGVTR